MIWIASSLLFILTSCGESDAASKPVVSKAQTQTEVAKATQGSKVSAKYKNGINNINKGDRQGKIRLHGSIPTRNNTYVHLFQTEGRNKTLIDSVKVVEGSFSFENIEVSRGFYELQLNRKPNNSCNIILNPDENNVEIHFTSSRLTAGKNSPNSIENKGWFAYNSAESKNKNEIKNLRKGIKDSPYRKRIEEQIKSKEFELVELQHAMIDQYNGTYCNHMS